MLPLSMLPLKQAPRQVHPGPVISAVYSCTVISETPHSHAWKRGRMAARADVEPRSAVDEKSRGAFAPPTMAGVCTARAGRGGRHCLVWLLVLCRLGCRSDHGRLDGARSAGRAYLHL